MDKGGITIKLLFKRDTWLGIQALIFAGLSFFLMMLDHYYRPFARIKSYVSVVVTPIQYVVSTPIRGVDWLVNDFSAQQKLASENARLRVMLLLLKAKLQKQYMTQSENTWLRSLLQSSSNQSYDKMLIAQLLAVCANPFEKQIILNKGLKEGVYVGQPVVDAKGVMGQVTQVSPLTSRVMLITDSRSSVPAQISRNGVRLIVDGEPRTDSLQVKNVTQTTDIKVGDLLITSGLGMRYPFGYPVGKVVSIEHPLGMRFLKVLAKPLAQIDRSRLLLLIWPATTRYSSEVKAMLNNKADHDDKEQGNRT